MAHFAQLDDQNVVLQVIVVNNAELIDPATNLESEAAGIAFCHSLFGSDTRWLQTSYNANIRQNYAGTGFTYDSELDAFIPPELPPETEPPFELTLAEALEASGLTVEELEGLTGEELEGLLGLQ